ncbi:putative enoyl-CoA hydratase echA8 [Planctomycetes bacterium Pla163]|uniref:Putative enoyl-CoA hydratase echA8 n=1 Tax=Rohdeia mirabilis TaxID=2528008 RepID=A0A518D323_9BACT|nr:putative enoyl-CoA hydratase echA8 [Planctomycetes bacterium Pla163]
MSSIADQFPSDVPDQPELVSCERDGHLVRLTIERPEVMNCLSFPTLKRLRTLFAELAQDTTVRAVQITGAGERAFCAGADLKERRTMPIERVPDFVRNIRAVMDDVAALPMPTIAVVNGFAFGGGSELMLACDLRIAAEHATFGLTEVTLAIIPGAGGTQRLPRLIGRSRAKDLILTGRKLDAAEAERIGLVNRVAPMSELLAKADELAHQIADNGPVAVRAAKDAIDRGCEVAIDQGLEIEAQCYERILPTEDRLEALAAFAEKRRPNYQGR